MRRLLLITALLLLAAPPALAQLSFLGLQNNLVQFVLDQISVPGEFEVTAEAVEEADDGATELVGLAVADADGVWLRVGRISLDWDASAILGGTLQINRLAAEDVEYTRAPGASVEVKDDADIAEDEDQGGAFDWPRAPLTLIVEEMRLDRVTIGPGAVAEQGFSFDALGSARDEGDIQALTLEVTRTDDVAGAILVDYRRTFEANTLDLTLRADEAAGGLVAELAGLPARSASRVELVAAGPLTDWTVDLAASSDDVIQVEGAGRVGLAEPIEITARLSAVPGPALDPGVARLLAPEAAVDFALIEDEDGVIRIQRGAVTSPVVRLAASGFYDGPGEEVDIDLSLAADPGVLEQGSGFQFRTMSFEGAVKGPLAALLGEGRLRIAGLVSDAVDVGDADLSARFTTSGERAGFAVDGRVAGLRLDRLTPELLGEAVVVAGGGFAEGVLSLDRAALETRPLTVEASGSADTGAEVLDFAYRAEAADLGALAAAYDTRAEGAFAMRGRLDGGFDAPRLDGRIALDGLALEDEAYGTVALTHDATFGAVPEGRVALTADGSRFGPAEVSTLFRLDGNTLSLTELAVAALDATVAGALDVDLPTTLMDGEVTLDIPSLARTEAATGVALAGSGGGTVALSTEVVEQAFGTTKRQQVADVDLAFRAFEGFDARIAALEIAGRLNDLLGDPGADLTLALTGAEHPQGALASGEIDVAAVSLTRRGSVDLAYRLRDARAPGLASMARLDGTAAVQSLDRDPRAQLALTAENLRSPAVEGGAAVARVGLQGEFTRLDSAPGGTARLVVDEIAAAGYRVARVTADAELSDLTGAAAARGTVRAEDVAGPDAALARAAVDFAFDDLTGAPAGTVEAALERIAAAGFTVERLDADARLADLTASPSVQAKARAAGIEGAGIALAALDVDADVVDLTGTGRGTAVVRAERLSGAASLDRATVRADMTGLTQPAGTIVLEADGVAAGGARIGRVDGDVRLTDRGSGRTDVSAEVRVPRVAAEGAEVRDIRLAAQVADALGTPRLDARLDVAAVDGEGIALDAPRLTVEGPLSRLAIAFTAAGEAIGKALNAEMRARVDVDGPLDATVDALQVTLDEARIALAEPLRVRAEGAATRIDNLALLLPGGRIVGAARLFPRGAAGQLAIDFDDLGALKTLDEAVPLARGTADVDARFDTRSGSAGAEVTARVAGLGLDGAVADIGDLGLALDGRWNGRVFDADAALSGPFGDPVRVTAGVPLVATGGPAPALNQRGPLRATVDWQGRLGDLWVLVPAPGHVLDGAVLVDLDVGGTPAAPTVGGRLEMADGQYQNLDTGTILTDLAVASQLAGTSDIALEISARDGASGTLDATVALREQTLDATVAVDRAVLVRRDDVTAQISADIAARGPLTGFALTGTTTIDRAEVRLVNAVPPSVADLGDVRIKGEPVPEEAEPAGGDITLDLAVRAPSDVFVRGRGLDSEWQIALDIAGTAAAPRISGSVERRRGELDFLGRVFDLEQGEVIFSGGREINPRLNVVLAHARDDVTGFIRVGGTANAPQVTFTSDPALPEDEVLPRVIFGRSAQSLSGLEALQLAGAVATLLDGTGGTVDQIRGAVGLDVLRLDSDDSGGTSVVVGRNVADGVFVGAKQPIDGGETSVQVEIEVFENITVDGEVGGDGDTSLGVNWRKNF